MSRDAGSFYRAHLISYARHSLSVADAVVFLRGALETAKGNPEMVDIQRAYDALHLGDDQLELIEAPQAKLDFDDHDKAGNDGGAK